ncbi:MAG: hypothetical protein ACR2QC_12440 [Gammaproteobacteria bacterium]
MKNFVLFTSKSPFSGDAQFDADYRKRKPPLWFQIVSTIILHAVGVGILYLTAKFYAIEAALLLYILYSGVMAGHDGYAEDRNMSMFLWNDKRLDERVTNLEESGRK